MYTPLEYRTRNDLVGVIKTWKVLKDTNGLILCHDGLFRSNAALNEVRCWAIDDGSIDEIKSQYDTELAPETLYAFGEIFDASGDYNSEQEYASHLICEGLARIYAQGVGDTKYTISNFEIVDAGSAYVADDELTGAGASEFLVSEVGTSGEITDLALVDGGEFDYDVSGSIIELDGGTGHSARIKITTTVKQKS